MRYASFFILHLKAFFSRSFLSISKKCAAMCTRTIPNSKQWHTMLATRCDSIYFQFSVLSLLHRGKKMNGKKRRLKRINGEKIVLFLYLFFSLRYQLLLSVYGFVLKLQNCSTKYMELIVRQLKHIPYFYACNVQNQCKCCTCLYRWLVDNDLQTY